MDGKEVKYDFVKRNPSARRRKKEDESIEKLIGLAIKV